MMKAKKRSGNITELLVEGRNSTNGRILGQIIEKYKNGRRVNMNLIQ